ncbi:lytic transglycosylase domain-containing protein [Actinomadura sp. PM05-2]|uniref:Lytic transglycosylase domain-containing protein n=2 Tax=Actinomadura parmotrematis TaxID=2864039 RepID=A0ABS7FMR6_9ACTN|nr:lytic transglycosylase domain-containing protein [Actinomadura parmotrematis]
MDGSGPAAFGADEAPADVLGHGDSYGGGPSGDSYGDPHGDPQAAPRRARRGEARTGRRGVKAAAVVAGAVVLVGAGAVTAFAVTGDGEADAADKTAIAAAPLKDAAAQAVDAKALEAQRSKQAADRASRAVRTKGKAPKLSPKGKPLPKPTPTPSKSASSGGGSGTGAGADPVPAGEAQAIAKAMLPSYGFSGSGQFACLVKLWNRESGWRTTAANPSGAYGIPQALPGSKMASAGSDWRTSARTQIKWGLGYIKSRHGTPCGAWQHSETNGWY